MTNILKQIIFVYEDKKGKKQYKGYNEKAFIEKLKILIRESFKDGGENET